MSRFPGFVAVALAALQCASVAPARAEEVSLSLTLYVANEGQADGSASSVSVIDGRTFRLKATIDFGKAGPIYAIASPDRKYLWVAEETYDFNTGGCDGSGVSVVNLETMKIETTIPLPQCPNTLVFSQDGRFAFTPSVAGPISVIDTAKRMIAASIAVAKGQYDLALSTDGRWLYAADASDANLTVIDVTGHTPMRKIALDDIPFAIALVPGGEKAFVTTISPVDGVEEINLPLGEIVAKIPPAVGSTTNGLVSTRDGRNLLDVDYSAQTLWIYSERAQDLIGKVTSFSYPVGIALSPLSELAYVTNNNCAAFPCPDPGFVTILDTRTHKVLGTVNVGINPQFITASSSIAPGVWPPPRMPQVPAGPGSPSGNSAFAR